MPNLIIHLFGSPRVERGGTPVPIERRKALALLAYLAVSGQAHSRDALAALLWPEYDQSSARANLRRILAALKDSLGDECLAIEGDDLRLACTEKLRMDVNEFRQGVATWKAHRHPQDPCSECMASLEAAVKTYTNDFMAGFNLADSAEFDEWQTLERQKLRTALAGVLEWLSGAYLSKRKFEPAIEHAQRWLGLDKLEEAAHRQLMRLYAASGQRSAVTRQYTECERVLQEELGVSPDEETRKVYEDILNAKARTPVESDKPPAVVPAPRKHTLPPQPTAFIGRELELDELHHLLVDPAYRLLTLTGPGGVGKTRLALEAARQQLANYPQGAFFVSLAPLASAQSIVPTIADALGFSFYEGGQPRQQLLSYLEQKNLLLILDNYEHLLEGVDVVADILKAAPQVKILVTSRASLKLEVEQRYAVSGMDFPAPISHEVKPLESALQFSSVKLFLQGAQRTVPGYTPDTNALEQIVRICRVLGGIPLAIRLASAWVELLAPAQIAAEIEQSIDFLETERRDVPERQRSMRAVFDHSWKLLGEQEQNVFAGLSVFRGGFTLEAARAVMDASLRVLMALVDRSLVQKENHERYTLHELLRKYAGERLAESPEAEKTARERHCTCFMEKLRRWEGELKSAGQVAALEEMDREIENCRAAWEWAVEQGKVDLLSGSMESLYLYHLWRRRIQDGDNVFQSAVEKLEGTTKPEETRLLVGLLPRLAAFQSELGHPELAEGACQRSQALLDDPGLKDVDLRREQADLFRLWGDVLFTINRERTIQLYKQSLQLYRDLDERWETANVLYGIAYSMKADGKYKEAKKYIEESLAIYRELGEPRGEAIALFRLGEAIVALGKAAEGEKLFRESMNIFQRIGDRAGYGSALRLLADSVISSQGRWAEARAAYEEVIPIFRDLGVQDQLARSIGMLGTIKTVIESDYKSDRIMTQESLKIAREIGDRTLIGLDIAKLAILSLVERDFEKAEELYMEAITEYGEQIEKPLMPGILSAMGVVLFRLGKNNEVRQYLCRALRVAIDLDLAECIGEPFPHIALWLCKQGKVEGALELFSWTAANYPAWNNTLLWVKDYMADLFTACASLPPEVVEAARERGRRLDPWTTAGALLAELEEKEGEGNG